MNGIPAGKRDVGFVFQNYAIFTHMSVYDNLAFGLRVRGVPKTQIDAEVGRIARMLGIESMLRLRAAQLSVNDLQKVALGRTIIIKPRIFLLDEPFSNLDAAFRAYMRTELKVIQREIGQTMVYVTHDQLEAMSMADLIAVMSAGTLQQIGSPDDVYLRPANLFVARFIGSPNMNFLRGRYRVDDGAGYLESGDGTRVRLDDRLCHTLDAAPSPEVVLGIRPEHLDMSEAGGDAPLSMPVTVYASEPLGPKTVLHTQFGGHLVQVLVKPGSAARVGEQRVVKMHPHRVYLFDAASEKVLA
jgi:multiple sugar transport system ATP-binding protein